MKKDLLIILMLLALTISIKHVFCENIEITKSAGTETAKTLSPDEYKLYKATYLGREGKIKKLIEKGTNVNIQSPNSKRSPLHIAVSRGKINIAKTLCNAGADPNIKNGKGETPLNIAIEVKRPDIIDYLKSKGAQVTKDMLDKANKAIKAVLEK